ncbi:hypothetical protein GTZ99_10625 [Novosphingobium sp. FSY-8]|uniref:Uncharacterized protein n=1 Tax=Novosphingobium ovatum TaxID=1908523 RepID=A0ABW9XEP4_9SPHN|nr:hypothetical protein [Novosphingobium ovatum]NBC37010.1 hypothetical protein [Novosphingobium ovatum]
MSIDFYAILAHDTWPTTIAVEKCLANQHFPVLIKRFPVFAPAKVVTNGALVTVDGKDAYLEGELYPASLAPADVADINERIGNAGGTFRIAPNDIVISMRTRTPAEARAATYTIASLIICFDAYGFEPQGNTHGRGHFAKSLVAGAETLKGL